MLETTVFIPHMGREFNRVMGQGADNLGSRLIPMRKSQEKAPRECIQIGMQLAKTRELRSNGREPK